jgi:hypothetical protein
MVRPCPHGRPQFVCQVCRPGFQHVFAMCDIDGTRLYAGRCMICEGRRQCPHGWWLPELYCQDCGVPVVRRLS